MGLAASQARLLTLTSRLSDLEGKAMRFANQKILMSMQQSDLATEYNKKLEAVDASVPSILDSTPTTKEVDINKTFHDLTDRGYTIKLNPAQDKGLITEGSLEDKYIKSPDSIDGIDKDWLEELQEQVANGEITDLVATPVEWAQIPAPDSPNYDTTSKGTTRSLSIACTYGRKSENIEVARTVNTAKGEQVAPRSLYELYTFLKDLAIISDCDGQQCTDESVIKDHRVKLNVDCGDIGYAGKITTMRMIGCALSPDALACVSAEGDDNDICMINIGNDWRGKSDSSNGQYKYKYFDFNKLANLVDPNRNRRVPQFNTFVNDYDNPTRWDVTYNEIELNPNYDPSPRNTDKGNQLWNEIQNDATKFIQAWQNGDILVYFGSTQINSTDKTSYTETVEPETPAIDNSKIKAERSRIDAEYDAELKKVQAEEKRIDLQATQINTEHQAVSTEIESVKSLIKDNTDRSFNIFG